MNVLINSDLSNVSSWGSAELFDRLCAVVDTATNQSSVAGSLQIMERLRQVTIIILYDIQHSRDCIWQHLPSKQKRTLLAIIWEERDEDVCTNLSVKSGQLQFIEIFILNILLVVLPSPATASLLSCIWFRDQCLQSAERQRVYKTYIHTSGGLVYGNRPGKVLTEIDSRLSPRGLEWRREMEDRVLSARVDTTQVLSLFVWHHWWDLDFTFFSSIFLLPNPFSPRRVVVSWQL